MKRSASRPLDNQRSYGWLNNRSVSRREAVVKPSISIFEFEAIPEGFLSVREFNKKNFTNSSRPELSNIRMKKAQMALANGQIKTPALLRMSKGLSQEQLGVVMGTSQPAIARLEAGLERPSFEKINRLQTALNVSFDELMEALNNVPIER